MTGEPIEALRRARENFVRKRRAMAEQMIPSGAAVQHFAPAFADVQAVIEAIDRAILDEERLPAGYALAEEAGAASQADIVSARGEGSNVVDVDFDPA